MQSSERMMGGCTSGTEAFLCLRPTRRVYRLAPEKEFSTFCASGEIGGRVEKRLCGTTVIDMFRNSGAAIGESVTWLKPFVS